ncbi:MAG: PSP1 domain-containing protein [Armatimonadota bacterium]
METARGPELGTVRLVPHEVEESQIVPPLKSVIRRAGTDDVARAQRNREREEQALETCRRLVEKLQLSMRLIDAEYNFDGSHLLIHFLAESRVDFRELVRELAHQLHTRIELRQVGVRDEAKLIGGFGMCGRQLCCSSFLNNFTPVAINMAKVQGLALNPQKISGTCGRLMCCLAFEYEHYKEIHSGLPRINAQVETPQGIGKVTKHNVIARQVEVAVPEVPGPLWFSVDEINFQRPAHSCPKNGGCGACGHEHHVEMADEGEEQLAEETLAIFGDESSSRTIEIDAVISGNMLTMPDEDNAERAEGEEKRRRRRRKKPGAGAGQPGGSTPPQQRVNAAPTPEGEQSTPAKRRRRRKPRPAQQPAGNGEGGARVPVSAQPGGGTAAPAGERQVPSGHYQPQPLERS